MTIRDKTSYIHEICPTSSRRLTTTNPPVSCLTSDRTNLLFTMSIEHAPMILRSSKRNFYTDEWSTPRRHTRFGGARRDRTDDLMLAKHALSQLSYGPIISMGKPRKEMVGPERFELSTSRLSSARSNQLSYGPMPFIDTDVPMRGSTPTQQETRPRRKRDEDGGSRAVVTRSTPVVRPGSTVGVLRGSRQPWTWTELLRRTSGS
jgi:hypothetical protein